MFVSVNDILNRELLQAVDAAVPRCTECVYDTIYSVAILTQGKGATISVDALVKVFGKDERYCVNLFADQSMDTAPALCDELDEKGVEQFIRDNLSNWTTGMPWLCLLPKYTQ